MALRGTKLILVAAPDASFRHSLVFALESGDDYSVQAYRYLEDAFLSVYVHKAACAVIDDDAVSHWDEVQEQFSRFARPVILLVDQFLNFITAAALMLLWSWLFREQPNPISRFLERGAIILVPVYAVLCDIAENLLFSRLIGGLEGEAYIQGIQWAVTVHNVRGALLDLQVILTVAFVILYGLALAKKAEDDVSAADDA